MLLTKITLDDVGVYKDANEFNLATTSQKPIILYGGINGTGKTTLFESIPLCLYGQNFTSDKITKKQYHQKIHRLFHHNAKTGISSRNASITLEFQYVQNSKINQYKIIRTWQNNDGKIDEFLKISTKLINEKKYSNIDLDESHLQQIVNQIIPKTVADLFFFDGEKIQDLANSGNDNTHIKFSFDSLLGLNISEQLCDDIGLYKLRNSNGEEDSVLAHLKQANQDKNVAHEKLEKIQEKRVFLNEEISRRHKDLQLKEEKFFKLGGAFAQNRQKLINKKTELDKHILHKEIILRDLVEKELPLAIITDQLKQVKKGIRSDVTNLKKSFEKDTLKDALDYIIKTFKPFLNSHMPETKKEILEQLDKIVNRKMKSMPNKQSMMFDFSLSDMNMLQDRIHVILDKEYGAVYNNRNFHKHSLEKRNDISIKLDVIPQQDEVGSLYSDIKGTTLEIGEMEQELQTLVKMEGMEKSRIVLLNSRIRKYLSKRKTNQQNLRGVDMIPRIQEVLITYSQRLRAKKIKMLESNILKGIQKCFHKNGLVTSIHIDPETYKVTLYRENGDEIPKEKMSKGELQMYATAIVWGLAKTSGHPLPFIIDTPLARLDEQHRENLIKYFYPDASHQTIILSTDTEIMDSYYDLLKPYISHVGIIQYDADNDCSVIDRTYFKKGGQMIAI